MKRLAGILGLGLLALGSNACRMPIDVQGPSLVRNASEVEAVLARFSAALASGNAQDLRSCAGPGFTLIEEGRTYDLDQTIASVREVLATGRLTRSLSGFHTRVSGNVAWSRYEVSGELVSPQGTMQLALLESAVLEHTAQGWRVVLVNTVPRAQAR